VCVKRNPDKVWQYKQFSSKCYRLLTGLCVIAAFLAAANQVSAQSSTATPQTASQSTPAAPAPVLTLEGNFAQRLWQFYREDWKGTLRSSPSPAKRGPASPLDSPPFPSSDWSYGGAPDIGAPDGNVYPVMTALRADGQRAKLYGWIAPGLDISTSSRTNTPEVYDATPNRLELDQGILIYERLPDTVQIAKFDWGFHFTGLYGTDYRYTAAKGYFSKQLLKYNRQYGVDIPLEYFDFYFPHVAQGMNLRFGRFISVPGIEAQLAPNNYIFSHSVLYFIDPFTDTGLLATVKFNDRWLLQGGITAGHDVAPWTSDAKPSGTACLDYTTTSVNDNFYLCANGVNSAKFAYDNVQQYDATWYHRFSKTWHVASEAWFMYQRDVPNVTPQILHPVYVQSGVNGAICYGPELRCLAQEYAAENYIEHELSSKLMLSFRSELVDDKKGQRTGYATKYTENTLSATRYIGSTIMVRPEIRFDHSWDVKAYDDGRARNQFTVAGDLIYRY
jgi:hypothetical protein